MKFSKIAVIFVLAVLIFNVVGCSKLNASGNEEAQKVVEDHFVYKSENNIDMLHTTIWEDLRDLEWNFENIANVRIVNIQLNDDSDIRDSYLELGRGNLKEVAKSNVRVFNVKYEVEFKEETQEQRNGVYDRWYFVIREDSKSPWLIDDFGM